MPVAEPVPVGGTAPEGVGQAGSSGSGAGCVVACGAAVAEPGL
jgi:hypothetical protein